MTLNLEAEIKPPCDIQTWTRLQAEISMNIANAKIYMLISEAERMSEFARLALITRAIAADYLHEAALYNSLYFEYGADRIQKIVAEAFEAAA